MMYDWLGECIREIADISGTRSWGLATRADICASAEAYDMKGTMLPVDVRVINHPRGELTTPLHLSELG
jgi:hypothetical protein